MNTTLEKPVEQTRTNPLDNKKLYLACVGFAADKSKKELADHVDSLLDMILKNPDDTPQEVKDQAAIFAYLSRRRRS